MFLAVGGSKTHNVEQVLIVLDGFHTNGTLFSEMLGYIVMLGINARVVSG
jgi:hypothetical protein